MSASNISDISGDLPVSIIFDFDNNSDLDPNLTIDYHSDTYLFHGYGVIVPLAIIIIATIILAIGGNVMVILTILKHRGMRTRTNMFIVNLAVADILVAALDMPVSLVTIIEGDWVFGRVMCQLNGFTMALFLICSIHTLMYISVHKYISITRPFSRVMTPRKIKFMILASWLWATFCAVCPLVGFNEILYKKGSSQCGPNIPKGIKATSHSLMITISNYVIPLAVMIFCYTCIFREIHVHMKRIRKTSNIDLENSVQQQKKVATTLFLVLACFLLCWTPFIMYSNAVVIRRGNVALVLNPLAYWCGYLNSACNPIIYAFRSPSFRKGYKEIMFGAPAPGLSAVHSLSFRSRSGRGSTKSNSHINTVNLSESKPAVNRQRTMLSQTSWRSLPIIPSLFRSFSTKPQERPQEPDSPGDTTSCGLCGFWKPRPPSPYEVGNADDTPPCENSHSLNDIKEDDEDVKDSDMEVYQGQESHQEDSV